MKNVSFVIASFAAVLALSSCQEQLTPRLSSKTMKANIKAENVVTKSSEDNAEFLGTIKGEGLQLDMFVSEGIMSSAAPVTKGQLYTTDNFGTAKVDAWLGQEVDGFNTHYINGGSIASNGDITANGETCYWLNEIPMNIWCYLPTDLELNTSAKTSATFNYNIADEKDIVVSYNNEMYEEGGDGTFDVTMKHALAGLRFDLRLLDADKTLKKVEIDGLNSNATCTISSDGSLSWSSIGSTQTYVYDEEAKSSDAFLPLSSSDGQNLLFFMPQSFAEDAEIRLTFDEVVRGETRETVLTGSLGNVRFVEGHTYTIRIKATFIHGEEPIDVEDQTISFIGKGDQKARFSALSPEVLNTLHISWDYSIGNNNGGRVRVRLCKSKVDVYDDTTTYQTIYCRLPFKEKIKEPVNPEKNNNPDDKPIDVGTVVQGNSISGSVDIYFDIDKDLTTGEFDIVFDYIGGNGGVAAWQVSNIHLSVLD